MVDLGGLADKAKQFLKSDKAEEVSDTLLAKGSEAASRVTGGKYDEHISKVRDSIDGAVGSNRAEEAPKPSAPKPSAPKPSGGATGTN